MIHDFAIGHVFQGRVAYKQMSIQVEELLQCLVLVRLKGGAKGLFDSGQDVRRLNRMTDPRGGLIGCGVPPIKSASFFGKDASILDITMIPEKV